MDKNLIVLGRPKRSEENLGASVGELFAYFKQ